jgi:beta-glucosidase
MTSFNALNGVPATANSFVLKQVLRDEWKYEGLVVSDYEAVTETVTHGFAREASEAARKAAAAGVDMEMVSTSYWDHLKGFDVKVIDQAVRNILRLKLQLGLFDGERRAAEE